MDYWHRLTAEDELPIRLAGEQGEGGRHLPRRRLPDAVRWFLGGEIVEAYGYSTHPSGDYDHATTTIGMLRFDHGAIAKISACVEAYIPYTFNIDLLGEEGTLRDEKVYSRKLGNGKEWVDLGTAAPRSGEVSAHPFQGEMTTSLTA